MKSPIARSIRFSSRASAPSLLAALLVSACAPNVSVPEEMGTELEAEEQEAPAHDALAGTAEAPAAVLAEGTTCLTVYTPPDDDSGSQIKAAPVQRTVFLNRRGGTYTRGSNNSSTNVSSIPSGTVTLPAYEGTEADWQSLLTCVRDQYARFNVVITDQDPGAAAHLEAVIGGSPTALGFANNVGGVSPFNCGVIGRSIAYVFSRVYSTVRGECEATAHEIGHSLGLEHEYLCQDPMTYLGGCGAKTFQDAAAQCGTSSAVACQCGTPTQNTVQKLLTNVGPSGYVPPPEAPDAPPSASITAPATGSSYARGALVSIRAEASDDRAIREVQLLWQSAAGTSSYRMSALGGSSYGLGLRLSSWAARGSRTLTVRAIDDAGQATNSPSVTVQVR
jgi:hypothetical protein